MRKIILSVAAALLAYLVLAWFTGNLLGLTGGKLWILRAALSLAGVAAAALVVWYFWDQPKTEAADNEQVASLIREAGRKLSSRIGSMPAILLLGEPSSSKTSAILNSGLEPELLAGQVYQDGRVVPTRGGNVWFARPTLFVEASNEMLEDAASRAALLKGLAPGRVAEVFGQGGQSARAAVVCVETERLTAGGQPLATLARNLRTRLGEIAEAFGIQLPVYVLFTKTDRLPFLTDFVHNLTKEEASQLLGAALPMRGASTGIYAEEQAARLGGAFDGIWHALTEARTEILARENDATKLPGAYEFPREFRKLRGSLIEFLSDLCRPTQLGVGPFLRGFYFSAVRPVVVREALAIPTTPRVEELVAAGAGDATSFFRVSAGSQAPAAVHPRRTVVSRKVPQWLFLTRFFNDVLLADHAATTASGTSAKADVLRRYLLAAAAAVCLVCATGFTVSFALNRKLEARVSEALPASADSLDNLERLRQSLATLTEYRRTGAPLRYRWGLYAGDDLYDRTRRLYFKRFQQVLFGQTQNGLVTFLSSLPASPGYDQTYNLLKAYLITTSNHDKSSRDFLSPLLLRTWTAGQTVDADRLQLAQKQFDFYAEELRVENPFSSQSDEDAVARARTYLKQFGDLDRIYQAMKAGSPQAVINFNRQVPDSRAYLVDAYDVAGPFTKEGWKFMDNAIRNPSRYVHGELWVLGDQGAVNSDPHELIRPLLSRYQADFIKEWRNYLNSATVIKYRDLKDAAQKLTVLSGSASPLFQLFALASQNIPWDDDPEIAKPFQPVDYLAPHKSDRLAGPQNKDYLTALGKLGVSLDAVTDSTTNQALSDARDARAAANQLALNFNPDPTIQKLLLDPIADAEAKLRGAGAAELNAAGQALCGKFRPLLNKYPFNPAAKMDASVAEVNQLLHYPDGAFWQFYDTNLKKLLIKQGNQYVAVTGGTLSLSPAFVSFFNQAASLSDELYAGGSADPHFSYKLLWLPSDGVSGVSLQIDGQSVDFSASSSAKAFTWQGSGPHSEKATVRLGATAGLGLPDHDGAWAVFHFFSEADTRVSAPGGGELFEWNVRSGAGGKPTTDPASGQPLVMRLRLDMSGSPAVFQKNYLTHLACVAVSTH